MANIPTTRYLWLVCILTTNLQADPNQRTKPDSYGPWRETYIQTQLTRNHPLGNTAQQYSTGKTSLLIGYRYTLTENWIMGVTGHFKSLLNHDHGSELAIFAATQETLYSMRIFHPHYLLLGGKLSYFLPAMKSQFPIEKSDGMETEIGGSLSIQYAIIFNDHLFGSLQLDRWRGFHSQNLNGFETSLGFAVVIP